MCILFQLFRPVDIGISQNEDHPPDLIAPQADPLLDRRDRKCLYTVFLQMCRNFIIPVAVGIGLHHGHQLTALRHSRLQYGGIVGKARQVQLNIGTLCFCKVFLLYSKAPPQRSHRKAK